MKKRQHSLSAFGIIYCLLFGANISFAQPQTMAEIYPPDLEALRHFVEELDPGIPQGLGLQFIPNTAMSQSWNYGLDQVGTSTTKPWSTQAPPSSWYGITWSDFDFGVSAFRVKEIDLSELFITSGGFTLSGDMPDSLFLYEDFFNGISHASFDSLEILDLSNNQITGVMPQLCDICDQEALLDFYMNNNMLDYDNNTLSNMIGGFDNIYEVQMNTIFDTMAMSGSAVVPIGSYNMPDLIELEMKGNRLSDNNASDFTSFLPSLEYLNLSENEFENLSFTIGYGLTYLSINDNELSSFSIIETLLNDLNQLEVFEAQDALDDNLHDITSITNMVVPQYLSFIDLGSNGLDGKLGFLDEFEYVEGLLLDDNFIDEVFVSDIGAGPAEFQMLYLDLSTNEIATISPTFLVKFPFLESLDLHDNLISGNLPPLIDSGGGLVNYYPTFENLRYFDISANRLEGPIPFACMLNPQMAMNGDSVILEYLNLEHNAFIKVDTDNINSSGIPVNNVTALELQMVSISDNLLHFKDFETLVDLFGMVPVDDTQNNLGQGPGPSPVIRHYLLPYWQVQPMNGEELPDGQLADTLNTFRYFDQKPLGDGGVRRRTPGDELKFRCPIKPTTQAMGNTQFYWIREDSLSGNIEGMSNIDYAGGGASFNQAPIGNGFNIPFDDIDGTTGGPGGSGVGQNIGLNGGFSPTGGGALSYQIATDANGQSFLELVVPEIASDYGTTGQLWEYTIVAKNSAFPLATLFTAPKRIIAEGCTDYAGAPIHCQEMLVNFRDNVTSQEKSELREELGVEIIDSCTCGGLELWSISDTSYATYLNLDANGRGTRAASGTTTTNQSTKLLSADPNYYLNPDTSSSNLSYTMPNYNNSTDAVRVAIIDSGVDFDHPGLTNNILNPNHLSNVGDSCELNEFGYNFINRDSLPYDDYGHGTRVAGIVAGDSYIDSYTGNNNEIAIMPIKYTDQNGDGTLFHAICGIRYAAENGAKVINASWGYKGEDCPTLTQTLWALDSCNVLFICAAGNDTTDITDSTNNYFPAKYTGNYSDSAMAIPSVISVGSFDTNNPTSELAPYSNYSGDFITLAAQGDVVTYDISMDPTSHDTIPVFGTSFAAPQVARAAALLFHEFPSASAGAVKQAILEGLDTFAINSNAYNNIIWHGKLNYEKARQKLANNNYNCLTGTEVTQPMEPEEIEIYAYPNPFGDEINLDLYNIDANSDNILLNIFTIDGRLIESQTIDGGGYASSINLNTAHWTQGMYILQIKTNNQNITQKLIKQ